MKILRRLCPAKINLFLDVLKKREDGYHDIHSVFLAIDLSDELELAFDEAAPPRKSPIGLTVEGTYAKAAGAPEANLVIRAAKTLEEFVGRKLPDGARFRLQKNIPVGAGLGGGSSDAASALVLANEALGKPCTEAQLRRLAATLGSDCAFFLVSTAAEATGRGDVLRPLPVGKQLSVLIVYPRVEQATAGMYGRFNPAHLGKRTDSEAVIQWLAEPKGNPPPLYNSFELIDTPSQPGSSAIQAVLERVRPDAVRMTGSGSAIFALFADRESAQFQALALSRDFDTFVCSTLPPGTG